MVRASARQLSGSRPVRPERHAHRASPKRRSFARYAVCGPRAVVGAPRRLLVLSRTPSQRRRWASCQSTSRHPSSQYHSASHSMHGTKAVGACRWPLFSPHTAHRTVPSALGMAGVPLPAAASRQARASAAAARRLSREPPPYDAAAVSARCQLSSP